ncbi:hypothetical protein ACHAWF_004414, partial [Thalassiosira exigua]
MKSFTAIALLALTATASANNQWDLLPSSSSDNDDYSPYEDNEFDDSSSDFANRGADTLAFFDEYDMDEGEFDGVYSQKPMDNHPKKPRPQSHLFLEDVAVERGQRGETLRSCLDNCNRLARTSTLTAREQCQRDCHLRFAPTPS